MVEMLISALIGLAAIIGLLVVLRSDLAPRWIRIPRKLPKECPECGTRLRLIRMPMTLRQFMWGGWTCKGCGVEIDRFGEIIGQ